MKASTCYLESVELRQSALNWLLTADPYRKSKGVRALQKSFLAKQIALNSQTLLGHSTTDQKPIPGRPSKPELVSPLNVKKRSMRTNEGRASLVHALVHIEFNAINLALDAVWRFEGMPNQYYIDWLKVAAEEAYHFTLLNEHLQTLGYEYGHFTGHNSLWEMVEKTQGDVLARMALVPRTMEARGLDANLPLRNKLAQAGDMRAAEILDIILRDEIGHVAIGNYWFNWLCEQQKLDPIKIFDALCKQYNAPKMRPPYNMDARRQAGFSEAELNLL
ncbi:MAG: ferritin-like domain-containing protein [Methylophilaceae bacterium]